MPCTHRVLAEKERALFEVDTRRRAANEGQEDALPKVGGGTVAVAFGVSVVAGFLALVGVGVVLAAGTNSQEEAAAVFESVGGVTAASMAEVVAIALGVGLAMAVARRGFEMVGLKRVSMRWLVLGGVGIGVLGFVLKILPVWAYTEVTGDESNPQEALAVAASEAGLLEVLPLLISVGLLVPLAEEVLFRGVLYAWLRRWGVPAAVVVSALVFGLFHGLNVVFFVGLVIGALNALVYEKSGSLWPAVISHAVNNSAAVVLLGLSA